MSAAEVIKQELDKAAGFGTGAWGDRVLDALKAAGYAVVELPDAESRSPYSWLDGSVTATRGLGRVRLYTEDHRLTSTDARQIAAALLAASDAAEVSE